MPTVMSTIETETVKVAAKQVTVPEHIVYPEGRLTIDSGVLTPRAIVVVTVSVLDEAGHPLTDDKVFKTSFREYPDSIKEVLGAVTISFNESPKPIV